MNQIFNSDFGVNNVYKKVHIQDGILILKQVENLEVKLIRTCWHLLTSWVKYTLSDPPTSHHNKCLKSAVAKIKSDIGI